MKWQGRRGSRNIEDRRGMRAAGGGGKAGIGGIGAIIVLIVGAYFGVDVSGLLEDPGAGQGSVQSGQPLSAQEQASGEFVAVVLADTEVIWEEIFRSQLNAEYPAPTLVLFSGTTRSQCGGASAATGPFYCPADRKAYLDTSFFATLQNRLGAQGDFAAAYVVAHEIAHHVQNVQGILPQVQAARANATQAQSNALSVRTELQADCYSGIWARYAQERLGTLERGDLQEAVNAARQIGDDTLQRNAGKTPMPHTFTHGTSEQRAAWFARGYESAKLSDCDTFSARQL
ncbi:neutral zinc metallopeptidase [Alphaproteobacteria bacterium KMM 3653]|uniref:Neutral zinc metallopeptidase n=1 Tax=Harenicola maris TaxID=2841044 RepID=A0AAP2CNQ8_9RHOB|nr:neutral zinc metallopeptidase [Harenicola maris]